MEEEDKAQELFYASFVELFWRARGLPITVLLYGLVATGKSEVAKHLVRCVERFNEEHLNWVLMFCPGPIECVIIDGDTFQTRSGEVETDETEDNYQRAMDVYLDEAPTNKLLIVTDAGSNKELRGLILKISKRDKRYVHSVLVGDGSSKNYFQAAGRNGQRDQPQNPVVTGRVWVDLPDSWEKNKRKGQSYEEFTTFDTDIDEVLLKRELKHTLNSLEGVTSDVREACRRVNSFHELKMLIPSFLEMEDFFASQEYYQAGWKGMLGEDQVLKAWAEFEQARLECWQVWATMGKQSLIQDYLSFTSEIKDVSETLKLSLIRAETARDRAQEANTERFVHVPSPSADAEFSLATNAFDHAIKDAMNAIREVKTSADETIAYLKGCEDRVALSSVSEIMASLGDQATLEILYRAHDASGSASAYAMKTAENAEQLAKDAAEVVAGLDWLLGILTQRV